MPGLLKENTAARQRRTTGVLDHNARQLDQHDVQYHDHDHHEPNHFVVFMLLNLFLLFLGALAYYLISVSEA